MRSVTENQYSLAKFLPVKFLEASFLLYAVLFPDFFAVVDPAGVLVFADVT